MKEPKGIIDLIIVILVAVTIMGVVGCATTNGFGCDVENAGRFIRERTQPAVDGMEMSRIRSSIDTQNRIMSRGYAMHDAVQ